MNKSLKVFLCAAMVAALALILVCGLHYRSMEKQLSDVQTLLDDSQANWKNIDAEKQILLETLAGKTDDLREAELSLSELNQKADDLKKDIEDLRQEIETLSGNED